MGTKITAADGRYSLIAKRVAGADETGITHVSSSELQPWIARNFQADGSFVGGRTLSKGGFEACIAGAKKAGLKIEEI